MEEPIFEVRTDLTELSNAVDAVRHQIKKIIVGQDEMVRLIIAALLADGHVLIEGVPGVAKTLTAKLVARSLSVQFSRIQFTPDLMPSDVLGTPVFNPKDGVFNFKKGPLFSNIVLIDEINRAPAKTQAALFEVMEEKTNHGRWKKPIQCSRPLWYWPPKIQLSRREPTGYQKHNWIVFYLKCWFPIQVKLKNSRY